MALPLASILLDRESRSPVVVRPADSVLDEAISAFKENVPEIHALAKRLASAVMSHGYADRNAIRRTVDECLCLSYEFTGESFDPARDLRDGYVLKQPNFDKFPQQLPGFSVLGKLEIGQAMARYGMGLRVFCQMSYTPTGRVQVQFSDGDDNVTPPLLLEHTRHIPGREFIAPSARSLPAYAPMTTQTLKSLGRQQPHKAPVNRQIPTVPRRASSAIQTAAPTVSNFPMPYHSSTETTQRHYVAGFALAMARERASAYGYADNSPTNRIDPSGLVSVGDYRTLPDLYKDYPGASNCASLAFRYQGGPMSQVDALNSLARGRRLPNCGVRCRKCEVKFWYWEFGWTSYRYGRRSAGPTGKASDFHMVGGLSSCVDASDPNAVWSKNDRRPLQGPRSPMSFRPRSGIEYKNVPQGFFPTSTWLDIVITKQMCYCLTLKQVSQATGTPNSGD